MDLEFTLAIIIYSIIGLIIYFNRRKFEWIQGVILAYRSKKPLKWMDKLNPSSPFWKVYSSICIPVSFYFIPQLVYALGAKAWGILNDFNSSAGVAPAIPGVHIPGSPIYIPLFYGIISIGILAFVHEMGHGIISKSEKIKLKSSGFGFFLFFPLFFVEPDEKSLSKASRLSRLRMISAGAGTNVILAFSLFLIIGLVFIPFFSNNVVYEGLRITGVMNDFPANKVNLTEGTIITGVNGVESLNLSSFSELINKHSPGESIIINTDKGDFNITTVSNPSNSSLPYIGVYLNEVTNYSVEAKALYGDFILSVIMIIYELISWIAFLNFSIGIMNLLPIWGLDGAKMLYDFLGYFVKEKYARSITSFISSLSLGLLIINIVPFFIKLFF